MRNTMLPQANQLTSTQIDNSHASRFRFKSENEKLKKCKILVETVPYKVKVSLLPDYIRPAPYGP